MRRVRCRHVVRRPGAAPGGVPAAQGARRRHAPLRSPASGRAFRGRPCGCALDAGALRGGGGAACIRAATDGVGFRRECPAALPAVPACIPGDLPFHPGRASLAVGGAGGADPLKMLPHVLHVVVLPNAPRIAPWGIRRASGPAARSFSAPRPRARLAGGHVDRFGRFDQCRAAGLIFDQCRAAGGG